MQLQILLTYIWVCWFCYWWVQENWILWVGCCQQVGNEPGFSQKCRSPLFPSWGRHHFFIKHLYNTQHTCGFSFWTEKCTVHCLKTGYKMPRFVSRFSHPGEKKAPIILSPMGFIASPFIAPKSWGLCKTKQNNKQKMWHLELRWTFYGMWAKVMGKNISPEVTSSFFIQLFEAVMQTYNMCSWDWKKDVRHHIKVHYRQWNSAYRKLLHQYAMNGPIY